MLTEVTRQVQTPVQEQLVQRLPAGICFRLLLIKLFHQSYLYHLVAQIGLYKCNIIWLLQLACINVIDS